MKAHLIPFVCRLCRSATCVPASKMLTSRYVACAACGAMNVLSDQQRHLRPARDEKASEADAVSGAR